MMWDGCSWQMHLALLALLPVCWSLSLRSDREGRVPDCHLFTLWNYSKPPPDYVHLVLQSWEIASKGRCGKPILINSTNIRDWIPDAPDELFRLPYEAAQSDAVRYALIYHNGGMYMDTDMLAVNMSGILEKFYDHDLITYSIPGQFFKQEGAFSSNFIAGRKGSVVMREIWEAQKAKMRAHCDASYVPDTGMCCYDDPSRPCSIRWAAIGEHIAHPLFKKMQRSGTPSFKAFSYEGDEDFAPDGIIKVLKDKMTVEDGAKYWNNMRTYKPFSRAMYHLFNSQGFDDNYNCYDLTRENTTVAGYLFQLSKVKRDIDVGKGKSRKCANDGESCDCKGKVFYGRRNLCGDHPVETDLMSMLQFQHLSKSSSGKLNCDTTAFGGDPFFGISKHCICQEDA